MKEIWENSVFDGYQISSDGRIRSIRRTGDRSKIILKPYLAYGKYPVVKIVVGRNKKKMITMSNIFRYKDSPAKDYKRMNYCPVVEEMNYCMDCDTYFKNENCIKCGKYYPSGMEDLK